MATAPLLVFSGTFDPPTLGHFQLLQEAAKLFPSLVVVCSDHSVTAPHFTQEERVALWQSYPLPTGITVETLADFLARGTAAKDIILLRGMRSTTDAPHENTVLFETYKNAAISKALYLIAPEEYQHISASAVWRLAKDKDIALLQPFVSEVVARAVLQRILQR
jgi:pantetheine-phosphate adenylyltransferase